MSAQLQITARDMRHSEALETRIRGKVEGLQRVHPRMTACRVTVEAPHSHQRRGNQYNVRLDITVPGEEIVVNRDHAKDMYVALRDAFQVARRKLIEHAQRGQGADKTRRSRNQVASGSGTARDE